MFGDLNAIFCEAIIELLTFLQGIRGNKDKKAALKCTQTITEFPLTQTHTHIHTYTHTHTLWLGCVACEDC